MRLVTRGDLDGLTCAVLICLKEGVDDILLVHPQDLTDERVDIQSTDIIGVFAFDREFAAPQAASCSLAMDIDNDGDLDLALVDELADEVILLQNPGIVFADGFESGDTSVWSSSVP